MMYMKGLLSLMIQVKNISKSYGKNIGIANISFEAYKNEILGLVGRNGAGKTTTLNIITGYISSDEGSVEIDGYDICDNSNEAKAKLGYLPEKPPIYMDMTVNEYMGFCAGLKGIDSDLKDKHIDEICALTGINEVRKRLCRNLSKGYKQRLGLAQALVGNPEILILDEPIIGLDPGQIIEIRNLIKQLGKKHTIIVSSHILSEIDKVCDRVIIIDNGRIIREDTIEGLLGTTAENKMIIRIKGADKNFSAELVNIEGVISADAIRRSEHASFDFAVIYKEKNETAEKIFDYIVKSKKKILMMKPVTSTLEDVFVKMIKNEGEKE